MQDMRELLLLQLEEYQSPSSEINIEVEWNARDFDRFIGQGSLDFHYEQVYRTNFTNDFSVIRSSTGIPKTHIRIKTKGLDGCGGVITHKIEKTTDEAVTPALMVRVFRKLGLYDISH